MVRSAGAESGEARGGRQEMRGPSVGCARLGLLAQLYSRGKGFGSELITRPVFTEKFKKRVSSVCKQKRERGNEKV